MVFVDSAVSKPRCTGLSRTSDGDADQVIPEDTRPQSPGHSDQRGMRMEGHCDMLPSRTRETKNDSPRVHQMTRAGRRG